MLVRKTIAVVLLGWSGIVVAGCATPASIDGEGGRSPQEQRPFSGPIGSGRPSCDENYSGCVPNVSYDLDCGDITGSVRVYGSDVHRFDRDGDGVGCESN